MGAELEGRIDIRLIRQGGQVARVEIRSSRPHIAQKLMAGRTPEEAADLAGLMFSLCGNAQKVAAQGACEAARGRQPGQEPATVAQVHAVLMEQAREHAWRLLLDWPEQAGYPPDRSGLLRLHQASGSPAGFAEVLEQLLATEILGEPPDSWLARDPGAFESWCGRGQTRVARLFSGLGEDTDKGLTRCTLLPPLTGMVTDQVVRLARLALADPAFCAAPLWQGGAAETGAIARMANHPLLAAWIGRRGRGAGARQLARLLELAQLPHRLREAATGPASRVVRTWFLGENCGIAGVETSRGLLLHEVRLEAGRVSEYRIIAPTEWNFHPDGALTQALTGLEAGPDLASRARLVSQSLDPCVAYGMELIDA